MAEGQALMGLQGALASAVEFVAQFFDHALHLSRVHQPGGGDARDHQVDSTIVRVEQAQGQAAIAVVTELARQGGEGFFDVATQLRLGNHGRTLSGERTRQSPEGRSRTLTA